MKELPTTWPFRDQDITTAPPPTERNEMTDVSLLFELAEKDVQFTHMNTRLEKHGEDDVLAVDLDMMISTSNEALAMLHPTLRWSLYDKPDVGNSDLADQAKAHELVRLRYPQLAALRWSKDLMNMLVRFHYGIDGKSDIVLFDCKINKFKIECHDGGTIDLAWRVQANPSPEQIGKLTERLSVGTVSVSIAYAAPTEPQKPLTNEPERNPLDAADPEDEDDDDEEDAPPPRSRGRGRGRSALQ